MSLSQIAWKNMWFKKSLTILTILSIAVATSLIIFIELMDKGLEKGIANGYGPYELVIGSEGSKSQLVLNTFYHVGAPVGNIEYEVFEHIENSELVAEAYPMTRGDNYKEFAIVGIPTGYLSTRYPDVSLLEGDIYHHVGDAVIGYHTAKELNLKVGDQFHGNHGAVHGGEVHTDLLYTVVGILPKLGTPDDKVIFTTLDSAWVVHGDGGHEEVGHEEEGHEAGNHEEVGHEEEGHVAENHEEVGHEEEGHEAENHEEVGHKEEGHVAGGHEWDTHGLEITAIVVKPKGLMELQQLRNEIDSLEGVQATYSSRSLSDVLSIIDTGSKVITLVAGVTIVIAGISILLALTARAAERKKDIGLLRLIGKSKRFIFLGLLLEANFMTLFGAILGVLLGHLGSFLLGDIIFQYAGIEMNPGHFFINELYIVIGILLLGTISALLPAIQSYRVNPIELFHS